MNIIEIEYVDHGAQGEYGFFGKIVARSNVRGLSMDEIAVEVEGMRDLLGHHVAVRPVEEVEGI